MNNNIIGALICGAAGFLVAFVNYAISKKVLETHAEKFSMATVLRQIIQVGYLIAVYFICSALGQDITFPLVGAVVGMTVPMLFFTKKLVSFNDTLVKKTKEGEDDING
ncbi:MAG: hypothetical protein IKV21_05740 [Clostridia bacterium]|nr:hypothetical protein [Clostridia bacterium]